MNWIDAADEVPLSRQRTSRATVYRRQRHPAGRTVSADDLELCRLIDEEYTNWPFYGSWRMVVFLRNLGHVVTRVSISMDGRGRTLDNIFVERLWCSVKHEDVDLNGCATMGELTIGLTAVLRVLQRRAATSVIRVQNALRGLRQWSGVGAVR